MGSKRRDSGTVCRSVPSLDGAGQQPTPLAIYKTLPDKNPRKSPSDAPGGGCFYPYHLMRTAEYRRNRLRVLLRDKFRCVKCGSRERLECAHIVAWVVSGDNSMNNLQTECYKCNRGEARLSRKMKWEQRVLYERAKIKPYV